MAWNGMNLEQQPRRLLVAVLLLLCVPASWLLCCFTNADRRSIRAILRLRNHPFTKRGGKDFGTSDDPGTDERIAVTNFALINVITNQTLHDSLLNDDDERSIFVLDMDQLVSASSSAAATNDSNKLKLTIRVDAQGPVHYVVMDWDVGDVVRTSLRQPFALAGLDDDPNQHPHEAAPSRFGHAQALTIPGMHSLQATPFDGLGRAGRSRTLRLRVVGSSNDSLRSSSLHKSTTTSIPQSSSSDIKHFFIRPPTEQERQRAQQGDEIDHNHDDELSHRTRSNHPPADSRKNKIIILHQIIHPQNASTTSLNAV